VTQTFANLNIKSDGKIEDLSQVEFENELNSTIAKAIAKGWNETHKSKDYEEFIGIKDKAVPVEKISDIFKL